MNTTSCDTRGSSNEVAISVATLTMVVCGVCMLSIAVGMVLHKYACRNPMYTEFEKLQINYDVWDKQQRFGEFLKHNATTNNSSQVIEIATRTPSTAAAAAVTTVAEA